MLTLPLALVPHQEREPKDERYWIVSDCLARLRETRSRYPARLELEVKLLQLRVKLLKGDSGVSDGVDLMPYQDLGLRLYEFLANGYCKEISRKIWVSIDELLVGLREEAAKRQMMKFTSGASSRPHVRS